MMTQYLIDSLDKGLENWGVGLFVRKTYVQLDGIH